MKVSELIEALRSMDGDLDVHFAYGYGDHWRTQVAPRVSRVDMGCVQYSDYHRMDTLVEPDYDDEEIEDGLKAVVIID